MAHHKRKGRSRKYGKCGMCTNARGNGKKLSQGRGPKAKRIRKEKVLTKEQQAAFDEVVEKTNKIYKEKGKKIFRPNRDGFPPPERCKCAFYPCFHAWLFGDVDSY